MYFQADINAYGIDWDGPLPEEAVHVVDYVETVHVPEVPVFFDNHQIQLLVNFVDPLKESDVFGIDLYIETIYIETKQIINNFLY